MRAPDLRFAGSWGEDLERQIIVISAGQWITVHGTYHWFDDTAKLETVNSLDEVIVSQDDMHIHCKSQTEIQCFVLCTYRQDLQSDHKPDSPKSVGDGLGGYSGTDTIKSDYFEGVDESDIWGHLWWWQWSEWYRNS